MELDGVEEPDQAAALGGGRSHRLLRLDHECGTIEEGKCADILVVDGDPLADIKILQDRSKLSLVMANGKVMVNTLGLKQELTQIPDFLMDIEHIQNAKAAVPTMPTAAEVQH